MLHRVCDVTVIDLGGSSFLLWDTLHIRHGSRDLGLPRELRPIPSRHSALKV